MNISCANISLNECSWTDFDHFPNSTYWYTEAGVRIYTLGLLSCVIVIINVIVTAALLRSWKKLVQKSIYIFAISISICDTLLGVFNFINTSSTLYLQGTAVKGDDSTTDAEWFYNIQSSIFFATEISSAGHTALIAFSYYRYVIAQTKSYLFPPIKKIYEGICGCIFLVAIAFTLFFGIRTILVSRGGFVSVLPHRLHLFLVRSRSKHEKKDSAKASGLNREDSMRLAYQSRMTHFIFYVMVIYVICRLPANFLIVIDAFAGYAAFAPVAVAEVLTILAFLHALINPIVYFFTLHHTKQAVRQLFDWCCCCCMRTVEVKKRPVMVDSSQ